MALFLAGLRSVDQDLIKAAQIDGAGMARIYRRVVIPAIGPIFIAVLVVLLQFAIKTFDLAIALTGGGPGIADDLPGDLRLRPDVPARPDRRGRGCRDHDPARARRGAGPLFAVDTCGAGAGRAAMASDADMTAYDPLATSGTWRRSRAKFGVYVLLGLFAAYYLLPLVVVFLNSFRDLPGDRRRTG